MLLSWILRSVGFDNQQTENMLFHDMIPAFLEAEEGEGAPVVVLVGVYRIVPRVARFSGEDEGVGV